MTTYCLPPVFCRRRLHEQTAVHFLDLQGRPFLSLSIVVDHLTILKKQTFSYLYKYNNYALKVALSMNKKNLPWTAMIFALFTIEHNFDNASFAGVVSVQNFPYVFHWNNGYCFIRIKVKQTITWDLKLIS